MIKLVINHYVIETCIEIYFGALSRNLISNARWNKASDINQSHIGKRVLGVNFGTCPDGMPLTAYERHHGATIVDRSFTICGTPVFTLEIDTQINNPPSKNLRYLPFERDVWYLIE